MHRNQSDHLHGALMTPSEKKARESLLSEAQALTLDWTRHKHLEGYPRLDERIAFALDAAELRGYQRGMAEATKLMQDNLRKGLTHDEA